MLASPAAAARERDAKEERNTLVAGFLDLICRDRPPSITGSILNNAKKEINLMASVIIILPGMRIQGLFLG